MTRCACGRVLHYKQVKKFLKIQAFIDELGPTIDLRVGDEIYRIQRHYLALHGLKSRDLPLLAEKGLVERIS